MVAANIPSLLLKRLECGDVQGAASPIVGAGATEALSYSRKSLAADTRE